MVVGSRPQSTEKYSMPPRHNRLILQTFPVDWRGWPALRARCRQRTYLPPCATIRGIAQSTYAPLLPFFAGKFPPEFEVLKQSSMGQTIFQPEPAHRVQ